ncbi:uncharacterized protein LOC116160063 isoform X2 [Photinus pyralis]|uniref:uncharacterized protein LOC116160063 isoform X2 n=1 Tax=Photinus pyralis TaxID=7054 RepID=UPI00126746A9|nr:uncharacterized protein LOC116160063 isoform X2 [Photinus pyralis]
MNPESLPVINNGGPLLDEEMITIHSDNSTIATGNLGDSFELDLLLAQLEGDPAASFMFEPARIIPHHPYYPNQYGRLHHQHLHRCCLSHLLRQNDLSCKRAKNDP